MRENNIAAQVNTAINIHTAVRDRIFWLWNLPPDDVWESKGAYLLVIGLAIATPFVAVSAGIQATVSECGVRRSLN